MTPQSVPKKQRSQSSANARTAYLLFADVVGFSRVTASQQHRVLDSFGKALSDAIADHDSHCRLIATGDGALVAFFDSPTSPIQVALNLQDRLSTAKQPIQLRIGLHTGQVLEAADIAGTPNLVGESISTCMRISTLASPGQILASSAYANLVLWIPQYKSRLTPSGEIQVKHGLAISLFAVESTHAPERSHTGTVFVAMPYTDEFQDLYSLILQPAILDLGWRPLRADDVSPTPTIIMTLADAIKDADAVVAILAGSYSNVFVVGVAFGLGKPILALAIPGEDVPLVLNVVRTDIWDRKKTTAVLDAFFQDLTDGATSK